MQTVRDINPIKKVCEVKHLRSKGSGIPTHTELTVRQSAMTCVTLDDRNVDTRLILPRSDGEVVRMSQPGPRQTQRLLLGGERGRGIAGHEQKHSVAKLAKVWKGRESSIWIRTLSLR